MLYFSIYLLPVTVKCEIGCLLCEFGGSGGALRERRDEGEHANSDVFADRRVAEQRGREAEQAGLYRGKTLKGARAVNRRGVKPEHSYAND